MAEAYYYRGLIYSDFPNFKQQEIADYTKAIEIEPNHFSAYTARGNVFRALKQNKSAIDDYTKAIECKLQPSNRSLAYMFYLRGIVYLDEKKATLAITDLTRSIELNPNYENAYLARGVVYQDLIKDDGKARADYVKAKELRSNPDDN